ncbi:hypothetical protein GCM10012280_02600 [Wenjunlia tyrosinilytica]|uniref:DUF4190 domain-containing protein n=2 Tax=Wenjunlia tyrosinilytica TaxID=1544741 RepID=A0A917ZDJ1_9ACTN|nr:hypothetical protein GCM10012280_02600 [Wenjunlia tyrosinilytica]
MSSFGHSRRTGAARSDASGMAVAGLVCGIVGLFVLSIVLGPLAIVFGWLAMGRRWSGGRPGMATAAFVLGWIDTVLAVIWLSTAATTGMLF